MEYDLKPLPYPADALEPAMDSETVEIHYGKHHATYLSRLNFALSEAPAYVPPTCPGKLLMLLNSVPANIRSDIRKLGGGHYNHSFFWKGLTPAGSQSDISSSELAQSISAEFGSFEAFCEEFSAAANGIFGSGWAWLILNHSGKLAVTTTPNQDSPLMPENISGSAHGFPILALDVWEHAYYLRYRNRRADFVRAFWSIVNWERAAILYEAWKRRLSENGREGCTS